MWSPLRAPTLEAVAWNTDPCRRRTYSVTIQTFEPVESWKWGVIGNKAARSICPVDMQSVDVWAHDERSALLHLRTPRARTYDSRLVAFYYYVAADEAGLDVREVDVAVQTMDGVWMNVAWRQVTQIHTVNRDKEHLRVRTGILGAHHAMLFVRDREVWASHILPSTWSFAHPSNWPLDVAALRPFDPTPHTPKTRETNIEPPAVEPTRWPHSP